MNHEEFLKSARRSALRILKSHRGKRPLPSNIADILADLLASGWLQTTAISKARRFRLSPEVRKETAWLAKRIAWMLNPEQRFGQQGAQCAQKTLRALQDNRITVEQLFECCKQFCSLRAHHSARLNSEKPRARPMHFSLATSELMARRLISTAQIDKVGHQLKNCLANPIYSKEIKSRLRRGDIQLFVLEDTDGEPRVLMSLSGQRRVEQVRGARNGRPIRQRDAIIEALTRLRVDLDDCCDLLELGICPELLLARHKAGSMRFEIDRRECEIGNGFLAVRDENQTFLLRGADGGGFCTSPSDRSSLEEAAFRVWLRDAVRRYPDFRRACAQAFCKAPEVFRLDWTGAR